MSHDKHLRCSFCGKSKDSVRKFISGPSVYICNECITLCNEILAEDEERAIIADCVAMVNANKPKEGPVQAARDQLITLKDFLIAKELVSIPSKEPFTQSNSPAMTSPCSSDAFTPWPASLFRIVGSGTRETRSTSTVARE